MKAFLPTLFALAAGAAMAAPPPDAADDFLDHLASHCGNAYGGKVIGDGPFAGHVILLQVTECGSDGVRLPFQVGDDTDRALVVSRTATGLQLVHDHRRSDGQPEALSNYGGQSEDGTALRHAFRADAGSVAEIQRAGIDGAADNVWTLEIEPGTVLRYALHGADGRQLVMEFDLAQPVAAYDTPLAHAARLDGGEYHTAVLASET